MVLLTVVLPTYNEADHIRELLDEVLTEVNALDHEVIVVDDDSPDGTWRVVEAYATMHPSVRVVRRRQEKGLATAVLEGFRQARGEYVLVMDSDGQHPPSVAPRMLDAALRQEADLVVGSRYAPGGNADKFAWHRRVISWGAKTLAVLGIPAVRQHGVRDPMSGLFLVRRDALPPLDSLEPKGYKILLELIAKGDWGRVVEVGYAFDERRGGASKLTMRTNVTYAMHVGRLALTDRENLRLLMFALVGASGILVNLAPIWYAENVLALRHLATLTGIGLAAKELAILWNFTWNDLTTFRDLRGPSGRGYFHRMFRYHVASVGGALVYAGVYTALVWAGVSATLSGAIAIVLGFAANWAGNRHWTYRVSEEAPDA